jgi:hypothetical protein
MSGQATENVDDYTVDTYNRAVENVQRVALGPERSVALIESMAGR